jgi:hypothetical protein
MAGSGLTTPYQAHFPTDSSRGYSLMDAANPAAADAADQDGVLQHVPAAGAFWPLGRGGTVDQKSWPRYAKLGQMQGHPADDHDETVLVADAWFVCEGARVSELVELNCRWYLCLLLL